jgi:hypothetical protein
MRLPRRCKAIKFTALHCQRKVIFRSIYDQFTRNTFNGHKTFIFTHNTAALQPETGVVLTKAAANHIAVTRNFGESVRWGKYSCFLDFLFLRKYFYFVAADPSKIVSLNAYSRSTAILRCFVRQTARVYRGRG